jgi:hypothetical protein
LEKLLRREANRLAAWLLPEELEGGRRTSGQRRMGPQEEIRVGRGAPGGWRTRGGGGISPSRGWRRRSGAAEGGARERGSAWFFCAGTNLLI